MNFRVIEIFKSIDGEGIRAGLPATFVRLAGCNLRCPYCDTKYSYENCVAATMSVEEIVDKCLDLGVPAITLTGGEPLLASDFVPYLINALLDNGFEVNVETNGTKTPPVRRDHLFYTFDYKCPSSGQEKFMNLTIFKDLLEPEDVVKFVVGTQEDLERAYELITELHLDERCHVFFSPVFKQIEPSSIVEFLLEKKLYKCKMQIQMHKVIWDPDMRGV